MVTSLAAFGSDSNFAQSLNTSHFEGSTVKSRFSESFFLKILTSPQTNTEL
jgi:hypothetical protein